MHYSKRLPLLLAVIAFALPLSGLAGGNATFSAGDKSSHETVTITWRDANTLRMRAGGSPGYFIMRDGKAYSVFDAGGTPRVMDMQAMMKQMRGMGGGQVAGNKPGNEFGSIGSIKATGASETVAGIKGRVYRMQWTDADGSQHSGEAVLTDNPLAVEMTQAYFGSVSAMFGSDSAHEFMQGLPGKDRGLLRVGDSFKLQSIERATPPASTFKLPAKPMDLQNMMRGMGGQ